MRIPRIYTEQLLSAGSSLDLEPGAAQHIVRVLRMAAGDKLVLFNGDGWEYPASLESVERKIVRARVDDRRCGITESPLAVHLGIAISRGDRMDWVVQKATELGASRLTPLFSQRTEVKLSGDRLHKKLLHWRQVAISACEQSGRNTLPVIEPPDKLQAWLDATHADCKYVLHHRARASVDADQEPSSVALLVGAEGGLTSDEIEAAERAGYQSLSLGPRVLRTETAPLAAITLLQARWGDMKLA